MKQKILDALKQGYKSKLGLDDAVFERVATSAETFITSEEQIPVFVAGAEPMLKMYQSIGDQIRTAKDAKIAELEAKLNNPTPPVDKPQPAPQPLDLAKAIADAVKEAITPISAELSRFKSEQEQSKIETTAKQVFQSNEYVKLYSDEANDSWDRAFELYEATGKKWNSEELQNKALGYFRNAVKRRNVDIDKPVPSDAPADGSEIPTDIFDKVASSIEGFTPKKD